VSVGGCVSSVTAIAAVAWFPPASAAAARSSLTPGERTTAAEKAPWANVAEAPGARGRPQRSCARGKYGTTRSQARRK
jgi:hypothetical protein